MVQLIIDRINELKKNCCISQPDKDCDVVLIGHGSSDRNAHDAFVHMADAIRPYYRNVHFCFLELDCPNIEEGIEQALLQNPKVLLLIPYFLHKGAHIKRDVVQEVNAALEKYKFKKGFLGVHLGVDDNLVDIMIERAKEVEKRVGI
jgi:precorrin-8X/cobalt-precorrin-8 methylmutase